MWPTGKFSALNKFGVVPDMICLSKSISGLGSPMSVLLINPALDLWERGEHTGTFRGFTYSYVTGAKALRHFWADELFRAQLCGIINPEAGRIPGITQGRVQQPDAGGAATGAARRC